MVQERWPNHRRANLARPNDILREEEVACIAGVCDFQKGNVTRTDWHSQPHDFGPVVYKGVAPSLFNVSDILIREIYTIHSPTTSNILISGCDTAFNVHTVPVSWCVKTGKTGQAYKRLGYQSIDGDATFFKRTMKLI